MIYKQAEDAANVGTRTTIASDPPALQRTERVSVKSNASEHRRRKSKKLIILEHMRGIRSTEVSVPVALHALRPLPSFTDVRGECEEKNNDSEPPDANTVEGRATKSASGTHDGHTGLLRSSAQRPGCPSCAPSLALLRRRSQRGRTTTATTDAKAVEGRARGL